MTLQATTRFLRRQLWVWPILAAVIVGLSGWWVSESVEEVMRERRASGMAATLQADITALRMWMKGQEENARLLATDERLVALTGELLAVESKGREVLPLLLSQAQAGLRKRLGSRIKPLGYSGFFLVSPDGLVLAADQDPPVGHLLDGYRKDFFLGVVGGQPSVSRPVRSPLLLTDQKGELRANLPTMFAAAPLRDESGKVLAALGLRIRPEEQFSEIFQVARIGETGETYALDQNGMFLSLSRFDDDLKQLGLLADQPDVNSVLTLEARDPQVDLTEGERPALRRAEQPLTRMAADVAEGNSGVDVAGYRSYRGVPVIGAWTWLPEYGFAVASEVAVAEVSHPLYILHRAFWVMSGLLGLSAIAIFGLMVYLARQQRRLQAAVLAARQLGQYTLEQKIGSGGMGTVYRARHAMLRRPTAVKLLDVEKMTDTAIARFEREVQLTSSLSHPNTVAIFDYGRTPEGIFFYAMEYLEGLNLDDLVRQYGALPEARVVHLLRQICGSLAEAHRAGLVHRDIKPANIFLTCRGGLHDFVKVLDFGLVKALDSQDAAHVTSANAVTGTPLYISPEAVNQPDKVDARSDVYAIGAVGYFLLAGSPVFSGGSVMEIVMKHVQSAPEPLSARRTLALSPELEQMVLRCLSKSPAERPADAAELYRELDQLPVAGRWTPDDAASWWATHATANRAGVQEAAPTASPPAAPTRAPIDATLDYERGMKP